MLIVYIYVYIYINEIIFNVTFHLVTHPNNEWITIQTMHWKKRAFVTSPKSVEIFNCKEAKCNYFVT